MGNTNATPVYLHIFNKATAPTPGTDSAVKTLIIPGNTAGAGSMLVRAYPENVNADQDSKRGQ
jgi:hypothetical protein